MAEIIKDAFRGTPWYMWVMIIFSIGILVGGFLCPPMGQIDPSVYKSVGVLFSGVILLRFVDQLPLYIERGARIKASAHPNTGVSIEVTKEKAQEVE